MDIPSEAVYAVIALVALGLAIALLAFFMIQGGGTRVLDAILGFFRGFA